VSGVQFDGGQSGFTGSRGASNHGSGGGDGSGGCGNSRGVGIRVSQSRGSSIRVGSGVSSGESTISVGSCGNHGGGSSNEGSGS